MPIRPATRTDGPAIWAILKPVIRAGETFALDRDMAEEAALRFWTGPGMEAFVADEAGAVVGTYYMRPNQAGGGGHVCNCGYMVAAEANGRGVARAMAAHSFEHARARGYRGMQFNFVVSSNERAVRLWQALGFAEIGRVQRGFDHPRLGFVDSLILYRDL
jgi:L-amino acid N-acyltransferase YncA